jgi:hypothetical protein
MAEIYRLPTLVNVTFLEEHGFVKKDFLDNLASNTFTNMNPQDVKELTNQSLDLTDPPTFRDTFKMRKAELNSKMVKRDAPKFDLDVLISHHNYSNRVRIKQEFMLWSIIKNLGVSTVAPLAYLDKGTKGAVLVTETIPTVHEILLDSLLNGRHVVQMSQIPDLLRDLYLEASAITVAGAHDLSVINGNLTLGRPWVLDYTFEKGKIRSLFTKFNSESMVHTDDMKIKSERSYLSDEDARQEVKKFEMIAAREFGGFVGSFSGFNELNQRERTKVFRQALSIYDKNRKVFNPFQEGILTKQNFAVIAHDVAMSVLAKLGYYTGKKLPPQSTSS